MAKLRWMKFYPSDWMSDPRLRRCRPDTRGVWIDLLSTMWLHGSADLEMNAQEIGRTCGTTRSETLNALRELQMTGTADIGPALGPVAPGPKTAFKIHSRRIARMLESMTEERSRFKERNDRKRGIARNDTVVTRSDSGETPPLDIDKIETKIETEKAQATPARPRATKSSKPDPVEAHREDATRALESLNAARKAVRPSSHGLGAIDANLRHIAARLADGYTLADVNHVIAVREAECKRSPDSYQWFNAESTFRSDNFLRALGGDPGQRITQKGEPARAEPLPFDQVFNGYKDDLR